jgi:hypothetical protein
LKEQDIRRILAQIESWMMMTCESCAMPEKIKPLLEKIRQLLESEDDRPTLPQDSGKR